MSFANSDLLPAIGGILLPLIGRRQIIAQDADDSLKALRARCQVVNQHLRFRRFLASGQVSIADFFVVGILAGAFMGFRRVMEVDYPDLTRWFQEVYNVPLYREVAGELPSYDLPFPVEAGEKALSNGH
jgi:elongation factor 1-gamma